MDHDNFRNRVFIDRILYFLNNEKSDNCDDVVFAAVILVIIGTYLLFTAGSVTLLKALKKNKGYFYKPNHFISVSGMIYRMKQNAAGLANICILSTMVLVMISTTFSLWIGIDDLTRQRYPREIVAYTNANEDDIQTIRDVSDQLLKDKNLEKENILDYRYVEFTGYQKSNPYLQIEKIFMRI